MAECLTVITIADRVTSFPSIVVPASDLSSYVHMAAGWNLLVEVDDAAHVKAVPVAEYQNWVAQQKTLINQANALAAQQRAKLSPIK